MRIIIIVAIGQDGAIGIGGRLPWQGQQRADMKRFVKLTTGFPIIVGRKTYESFQKRPLPDRVNIVITRNAKYPGDGCVPVPSLAAALARAEQEYKEKVFVIGGNEIYRQTLPCADELNLTLIHGHFDADTFFPSIDRTVWREIDRISHEADERNVHPYSFVTLEKTL